MPSNLDRLVERFVSTRVTSIRGPGLQPWGYVEQAALVVLDAIYEERVSAAMWDTNDDPAAIELLTNYNMLFKIAVRSYAERYPKAKIRFAGWTRNGITWTYPPGGLGEHNATCIFCREDVIGLGKGRHQLPKHLLIKIERHTGECAMKLLAGRDESIRGPKRKRRHRRMFLNDIAWELG